MKKAAIVLSWIMLGLFGITFVTMGIRYPSTVSGGSLIFLLPYAAALLAFKADVNRLLIGGSWLLNGLMVAVSAAYGVVGIVAGEPLKAMLALLILLPSPLLNCIVLKWAWNRALATANSNN